MSHYLHKQSYILKMYILSWPCQHLTSNAQLHMSVHKLQTLKCLSPTRRICGILSSTPAAKSPRARPESVIMEPLCPYHTEHCMLYCALYKAVKGLQWVGAMGHPVEWRDIKTAGEVLPTLYKVRRCDTICINHVLYTSVNKKFCN